MKRWLALFTVAAAALAAGPASAQEVTGAQRMEITAFPGGGILFAAGSKSSGESHFTNYAMGGSLTYNVNRHWGVEGEFGGALDANRFKVTPSGGFSEPLKPAQLTYQGNVLFYPSRTDRRVIPYVTGGIGGLSMLQKPDLGIDSTQTFLTGNTGAGVKTYLGRLGVRGDYRFFAIRSSDSAPAFFGRENRYGHRVYGGLVFTFGA